MRRLAQFVRRASACVGRLSRVSRLVSRLSASGVCVRLASRVPNASCLASVCICLRLASVSRLVSRQGFRMRASCLASVCICLRLASVSRRSSCLASCLASVSVCASASRVCLSASCVSRLSVLVNACGDWLILCVGRHSKSLKGRHTIL